MTVSRRDVLLGLGASAGLTVSFPALATPSTSPIDLGQHFLPYWRNAVWKRHFHRGDWWPSLNAYSWHFDDKTYDTPLISCADNGRVFQIIRLKRDEGPEIGVFEFWVTELMKPGTPDRYSNELAGAARFAADWALEAVPQRRIFTEGTCISVSMAISRPLSRKRHLSSFTRGFRFLSRSTSNTTTIQRTNLKRKSWPKKPNFRRGDRAYDPAEAVVSN